MIPFSHYMHEWLYGENGYYAKSPHVGKDGDFYTSVSTSMFFGGSIANYIVRLIDANKLKKDTTIVEIGAHKGYMLADIVQFIFTLRPNLLESLHFVIVEPLNAIRRMQEKYLKDSFGQEVDIRIIGSLKDFKTDEAFIVSNELFDAFACEIVKDDTMLYVKNNELFFDKMNNEVKSVCDTYNIKKGEVCLGFESFAKSLNGSFDAYRFVSFDYGQMDLRGDFSIRVYKDHETYPFFELTPFTQNKNRLNEFFQKSDITSDVNFLHLKDLFEKAGASMVNFSTQMRALDDFGISTLLEILHKNVDEQTYKHEIQKVKQLLLPEYFGERFKMIEFVK